MTSSALMRRSAAIGSIVVPGENPAPRENPYHINYRAFEADARWAVAMQILEIAVFPAQSERFAELERQAIERIGDRDRAYYLAYLDSQAAFEWMNKQWELYI